MSLAAVEMKKSIRVNCEMLQALSLNKKQGSEQGTGKQKDVCRRKRQRLTQSRAGLNNS